MTQTRAKRVCDAKAMAVAEAVFEAVRPMAVILFGSRARGDYREDSFLARGEYRPCYNAVTGSPIPKPRR